ncbi:hypothetical protein VIM7927_01886 [Vibrio mangrovi]|uniref:Uncharacterized protein n=1 Tax=Vibrio mangrovi TaxID=474394 RepID=A0A1Y6ISH2_9VIBR|nr:hypothetical protein VIM7927_01886 [Vibrio mangrovi]
MVASGRYIRIQIKVHISAAAMVLLQYKKFELWQDFLEKNASIRFFAADI